MMKTKNWTNPRFTLEQTYGRRQHVTQQSTNTSRQPAGVKDRAGEVPASGPTLGGCAQSEVLSPSLQTGSCSSASETFVPVSSPQ